MKKLKLTLLTVFLLLSVAIAVTHIPVDLFKNRIHGKSTHESGTQNIFGETVAWEHEYESWEYAQWNEPRSEWYFIPFWLATGAGLTGLLLFDLGKKLHKKRTLRFRLDLDPDEDRYGQMKSLKKMYDDGLISEKQFARSKKKLLR